MQSQHEDSYCIRATGFWNTPMSRNTSELRNAQHSHTPHDCTATGQRLLALLRNVSNMCVNAHTALKQDHYENNLPRQPATQKARPGRHTLCSLFRLPSELPGREKKKKKRSGGKKLEIKPILPNGEQDTIPIPHTHTRCALDAMYNTVPFHLRRHQTNKREKKPSP